jgi:hypothetical protein
MVGEDRRDVGEDPRRAGSHGRIVHDAAADCRARSALGAPVTGPQFPLGRYGRRREPQPAKRWIMPLLVGVVVLASLGIGIKLYGQYGTTAPEARVLRWTVVTDQAIRIEIEVPGDRTAPLHCTLRSRGRDGSEVGHTEATVPAGKGTVTRTIVLNTRARAVTGELVGCTR